MSSHDRRIHSTSISLQNPQVTRPHHRAKGLGPGRPRGSGSSTEADTQSLLRIPLEADPQLHSDRRCGRTSGSECQPREAQRACENPTQPHPQGVPGREPSGLISSAHLEVQPLEWSTYQWWWVVSTVVSFTPCFFATSTTCNQTSGRTEATVTLQVLAHQPARWGAQPELRVCQECPGSIGPCQLGLTSVEQGESSLSLS